MGWAWTNSLIGDDDFVTIDSIGITLRDRPSVDGEDIGLVFGLVDVVVIGKPRCGYTPVLIHASNFLSRISPQPAVYPHEPAPTKIPPIPITPTAESNISAGWTFSDELTVLGETAISGPLGVNLRAEACHYAENLGFIPAGANMIVTGLAIGDYTPVRINTDVLQVAFDTEGRPIRSLQRIPEVVRLTPAPELPPDTSTLPQ
jgi:hypothetical protein